MRVLVADSLPETDRRQRSRRAGHQCVQDPSLGASDLAGRIAGVDVLVVRSTKVGADVFEAADRLGLVVRAGAGTNTIDTAAAAARGVLVANVPGQNSAAVAELTIGLLIAVDRRIADNVADLRAGRWDKKGYSRANGLLGSTLGIVGLGSIGMCVAERARAFGINVQARAELSPTSARPGSRRRPRHRDLRRRSRTCWPARTSSRCTCPAAPETRHLVDRDVPRAHAARRDPAQHLPRRRGGRGRAAGGARRGHGARRSRRVRRRAGHRHGRLGLGAGPASRGGRHPPHRGLHRAGPARHRRRGRRGHRRVRRRRGPQRREPRRPTGSAR